MITADPAQSTVLSSAELLELTAVAKRWADDVPGSLNLQLDSGDPALAAACWNGICEIGFDRCLTPEAAGGPGLPLTALLAILQEVAAGDGGMALLTLLVNVAGNINAHSGHPGLTTFSRPIYVPASSVGGHNLPVFRGGEVNGEATFVLAGQDADSFVIEGLSGSEPALLAVDRKATGVLVTPIDDQLGLRAAAAVQVVLDGAPATVVGHADDLRLATITVNLGVAAIASGIAHRARAMAHEYAANRMQGGTAIINYGAVREMLGAMTQREAALRLPSIAASATPTLATALATKAALTDAAVATTLDAVQVFGGMGYMHETGVEKLMRDAKYCQLYPQSNWLARDALVTLSAS